MSNLIARQRVRAALACLAALAWAGPAAAHTGHGASGFAHGFAHPFSGLDHMLAMVGVGLLACTLKGRALWLAPLTFVAIMSLGAIAGAAHLPFAGLETAIAASVVLIGALIAFGPKTPLPVALAVIGFAAIFHGYAHGVEMPGSSQGMLYGAGFALATALLHASGIVGGLALERASRSIGSGLLRASGAAISVAGVVIAVAALS